MAPWTLGCVKLGTQPNPASCFLEMEVDGERRKEKRRRKGTQDMRPGYFIICGRLPSSMCMHVSVSSLAKAYLGSQSVLNDTCPEVTLLCGPGYRSSQNPFFWPVLCRLKLACLIVMRDAQQQKKDPSRPLSSSIHWVLCCGVAESVNLQGLLGHPEDHLGSSRDRCNSYSGTVLLLRDE